MSPAQHLVVCLLRGYRLLVSPVLATLAGPLGGGCRFTPTCSEYAAQAVRSHGVVRGSALAARRLCRCHPWGDGGHDPVPAPPLSSPVCARLPLKTPRPTS